MDALASLRVPQAVAGGWFLDVALGSVSRPHAEVDLPLFQEDQAALHPRGRHASATCAARARLGSEMSKRPRCFRVYTLATGCRVDRDEPGGEEPSHLPVRPRGHAVGHISSSISGAA